MIKVIYEENHSNRELENEVFNCNAYITDGSQKVPAACLIKLNSTWCAVCPNLVGDKEYTVVQFFGNTIAEAKHNLETRVKEMVTPYNFCAMNLVSFMDPDKVITYEVKWQYFILTVLIKNQLLKNENNK